MLNDPYIEVINKTRSLNLDEKLVEQSIDFFMKSGGDKTFMHLVHERKLPEETAHELTKEIKKVFRSSYYQNALYAGVLLVLFAFLTGVIVWSSYSIGFWMIFFFIVSLYCFYLCVRYLVKASGLK
jgi:hypothetical protein